MTGASGRTGRIVSRGAIGGPDKARAKLLVRIRAGAGRILQTTAKVTDPPLPFGNVAVCRNAACGGSVL
jgi:hypothetical protein